tara:strand:+ start:2698 stop:2949 length:252 start_codon:yes stop_codon:yes gene_type:complete
MAEYHCTYKKEFPVDEYGRLGGFYSLADLPIVQHKEMTRTGIIEAQDKKRQSFKIRDIEKNFIEWVPMTDVTVVQDSRKLQNG